MNMIISAKSEIPIRTKLNMSINKKLRKILLICGILCSLLYIVGNVITVMLYEDYSAVSQTVSELSAIGAPTRKLWIMLMVPYSLLRSEEHTSELQSHVNLVCRLLLEKKKM